MIYSLIYPKYSTFSNTADTGSKRKTWIAENMTVMKYNHICTVRIKLYTFNSWATLKKKTIQYGQSHIDSDLLLFSKSDKLKYFANEYLMIERSLLNFLVSFGIYIYVDRF